MKTMLATIVAGTLVVAAASGFAAAQATPQKAPPLGTHQTIVTEGNTTTVTPEERAKLKAEKAAKKEAAAKAKRQSAAEKRAELKNAAKATQPIPMEGNTTGVSAEERAKLQAERAGKKDAAAKMTPEQKKAAAAEKEKQTAEAMKDEKAH